jgi:hypothetical protein
MPDLYKGHSRSQLSCHFYFTGRHPSSHIEPGNSHPSFSSTTFLPQLDWLKFELDLEHFSEAGFADVIDFSTFPIDSRSIFSFNDASSALRIGDFLYEI